MPNTPKNFRIHPFFLFDKKITIAAMAGPDNNLEHQTEEDYDGRYWSLKYLKEAGIDVLIGFEKNFIKEAEAAGLIYHYIVIPEVPMELHQMDTPCEVFNTIYELIKNADFAGKKVCIHCNTGNGRSGTALAALKLRELIEAESLKNPDILKGILQQLLREHIRIANDDSILYSVDAINNETPSENYLVGSRLTRKAILAIRTGYVPSENTKARGSVENQDDLDSLLLYELHLKQLFHRRLSSLEGLPIPRLPLDQLEFLSTPPLGLSPLPERKPAPLDVGLSPLPERKPAPLDTNVYYTPGLEGDDSESEWEDVPSYVLGNNGNNTEYPRSSVPENKAPYPTPGYTEGNSRRFIPEYRVPAFKGYQRIGMRHSLFAREVFGDYFYAGSHPAFFLDAAEQNLKTLRSLGIKTIYSLERSQCDQITHIWLSFGEHFYHETEYGGVSYFIEDFKAPSFEMLDAISDSILAAIGRKEKLYLHCQGGMGRTGTVLAATYMKATRSRAQAAIDFVRSSYHQAAIESPEQESILFRFFQYSEKTKLIESTTPRVQATAPSYKDFHENLYRDAFFTKFKPRGEDQHKIFGCQKKERVPDNWSVSQILEYVTETAGQARDICVELEWINTDGTKHTNAPEFIADLLHDLEARQKNKCV